MDYISWDSIPGSPTAANLLHVMAVKLACQVQHLVATIVSEFEFKKKMKFYRSFITAKTLLVKWPQDLWVLLSRTDLSNDVRHLIGMGQQQILTTRNCCRFLHLVNLVAIIQYQNFWLFVPCAMTKKYQSMLHILHRNSHLMKNKRCIANGQWANSV